jgi:cardiolipin synthase
MKGTNDTDRASSAVFTIPNLLSILRILLIPVFVTLIVRPSTTTWGLIVFGLVAATDWVDGWVARRIGQVSELGKILDPTADRLAMAAGLIAFVVRGVFPLWAALLVLIRDGAILVIGAALLSRRHVRIDVRTIGKVATFTLMCAIPSIAWGRLELPLAQVFLVLGWVGFAIGIAEYYVAAGAYVGDIRRALAKP